jgi:hypothetical protein
VTIRYNLTLKLRLHAAISPHPHMSSCRGAQLNTGRGEPLLCLLSPVCVRQDLQATWALGPAVPAKSSLSGELSLLLLLSWWEELLAREMSMRGVDGVCSPPPTEPGEMRVTSSLIPGRGRDRGCFSSGLSTSSLRSSNEAKGAGPIRRCL